MAETTITSQYQIESQIMQTLAKCTQALSIK
jgi:hypothetical protein